MVSHQISDEGVGGGREKSIKIISIISIHWLAQRQGKSQDGHGATSCVRIERFLCQRAQQTSLNNVINHGTGSLSLLHMENKHTNNYTL